MTATPQAAPAEVVRPGVATQRINSYNRDGSFNRQVRFTGTEAEARAYVARLATHQ